MTVYLSLLAVIGGLAWPLCILRPSKRKRDAYLAVSFLLLYLVCALRYGIGSDYFTYIYTYDIIAAVPPGQFLQTNPLAPYGITMEASLALLMRLCALCGLSVRGFYAVMAALCLLPVWWFIRQNSPCAWMSVWLYVTLFCFMFTMDFVRQALAVGVSLLGYPLLNRRGVKPALGYLAVVGAAMVLHLSAAWLLLALALSRLPFRRWTMAGWLAVSAAGLLYGQALLVWGLGTALPALGLSVRFENYLSSSIYMGGMNVVMVWGPAAVLIGYALCLRSVRAAFPNAATPMGHLLCLTVFSWLMASHTLILARLMLWTLPYAVVGAPMALVSLRPLAGEAAGRGKTVYRLAVGATLALSLLYFCCGAEPFGSGLRGMFHCFPYRSLVSWLNRLP